MAVQPKPGHARGRRIHIQKSFFPVPTTHTAAEKKEELLPFKRKRKEEGFASGKIDCFSLAFFLGGKIAKMQLALAKFLDWRILHLL